MRCVVFPYDDLMTTYNFNKSTIREIKVVIKKAIRCLTGSIIDRTFFRKCVITTYFCINITRYKV